MLIKILLIVAVVIQTIATLFAIRLIRTTKYNSIWILFTIGFTLLSVERVVQFLRANGQTLPYEVFVWLGLVISISMSIGVMYAHKLFKYIARLNRQRQLLNKRILRRNRGRVSRRICTTGWGRCSRRPVCRCRPCNGSRCRPISRRSSVIRLM